MSASEPVFSLAAVDAAATELGRRLRDLDAKVVTVESCTGGLMARALTEAAGSSQWFDRGLVTYSNQAKVELAGVRPETLSRYGAVSEEVAREMAAGALASAGVALAISVTGVAGPSGGSEAKPVGTVCFGWARAGEATRSETCHFTGDRVAVRSQAALHALRQAGRLLAAASRAQTSG